MSVVDIDSEDDDKWLDYVSTLTPRERNELLVRSAGEGELWRCERLIENGADPSYQNYTALSVAAAGGRAGVLEMLLKQSPDEDAKNAALTMGVTAAQTESVRLLLKHNTDARRDSATNLWYAAMNGRTEIAELLLTAGADVTAADKALMGIALSHRNEDTALVFLRHGADPSALFKDRNAFEWAAEMHLEGFFKAAKEWVQSDEYIGPDFFKGKTLGELRAEIPGRKGRTGFHLAASAGSFDVIAEKMLATPGEAMRSADLLRAMPPAGPSVLFLLGETGQLKLAFDARLWLGRRKEMLETFGHVAGAHRPQVDIDKELNTITQMVLKQSARKFNLKPG